jgi:hypothetical protein
MVNNKKIANLTVLLVVIIGIMAVLFVYQGDYAVIKQKVAKNVSNDVLVILSEQVAVPSNRQIVSDRYVADLDVDGELIVIGDDGAYSVQKGVVLINDRVVSIDEEEVSVYDIENPEMSVSSN